MDPISDDGERRRRARLANMRQELLAPVTAIVGYQEIVLEEARRLDLRGMVPDLERVLGSARRLLELVDRLLDDDVVLTTADRHAAGDDLTALQAQLRHDLRTPLNVIIGYSEMLLEDVDDLGAHALRPDLERLLAESARLLAQLEVIVDFSSREGGEDPAAAAEADGAGAMVAELVRAMRPGERGAARPHETGRILVVDDNESNRSLLFRRLTREGHEVIEAESGRRALECLAVEAEGVDLILLDLMMPEMNGFEVLERLKADPRLRDVPVIMISGLREADSVIRCIEAGAEDYLPKPFNPVLLRARINACLERKRWHDRERDYLARLEAEKEKVEALLHNILPGRIVARLNGGEVVIADRVEDATILFCDLVDFTPLASRLNPAQLVATLNRVFSQFDALAHSLEVEKIKTIGDSYMAAAGLLEPRPDHAEVMAELALGMLDALAEINRSLDAPLQARIGVHNGPVIAGVIGTHKFIYDVWGDTVNIASRLEAHGVPDRVHVSERTRRALQHRFDFEPRGMIPIKGKGRMRTFLLLGRKGDAAAPIRPARAAP